MEIVGLHSAAGRVCDPAHDRPGRHAHSVPVPIHGRLGGADLRGEGVLGQRLAAKELIERHGGDNTKLVLSPQQAHTKTGLDGCGTGGDHAEMASNPRNRIRELRERAGLSQEELARRLNTSQPQVFRLEKTQRGLTHAWMVRLAKALRVELWELVQDVPVPAEAPEMGVTSIPVRGHVQAGDWREAMEWPRGDWYGVLAPNDFRWPRAHRFALEVRGPSMNRLYPDGSVVICVLFEELGREPRSGERVVVERVNRAGQFEATLKEFVVESDGRRWLWPRSDDPDHQQPIPIDGVAKSAGRRRIKLRKTTTVHADASRDDGIESLRIYAKVVGSYRPE